MLLSGRTSPLAPECPQGTVFHKPLQCESFQWAAVLQEQPKGSQGLPANLLHCGLLFPMSLQVMPGACSSVGFARHHSFLQASSCSPAPLVWGPSRAAGGSLLHHGLQGHSSFTTSCKGISAPCLEHLFPVFLWPWCPQGALAPMSLFLSALAVIAFVQ